jgi:hypothetical protein
MLRTRSTRFRSLAASAVGLASLAAIAVACTTDYQKGLEDPNFGAPNALAGQKQPGSTSDYTTGTTGGDGDGGGSSSGGAVQPTCVQAGGTLLADAGPCAVSFKTDILGAFGTAAPTCASSATCHGGQNPSNQPRIDPGDPAGSYKEFSTFKMSTGLPYINPCSTDETKAGIACNLAATACGSHMPIGGQIDPTVLQKFTDWLKCGSPNN